METAQLLTPPARRWPRVIARLAAVYALGGGTVTLAGWWVGVRRLTDWWNDGLAMFANTAACAVLGGLALLLSQVGGGRAWRRWVTVAAAGVTAVVGGLTVLEHLTGANLGIDTILFSGPWGRTVAAMAPMRMGPPACTCYLMIGIALAILGAGRRGRRLAAGLGVAVVAVSMLSMIGYLYGARQMYMLPRFTGIAPQTASILLGLGLGVVASVTDREPMRSLLEPTAAGALARRALPIIVLLSLTLGWARIRLQGGGVVDPVFGTALRTLFELALLSGLLWSAVRMIRTREQALLESDAAVRRQAAQLATFLETAAICLHRVGPDGTILWANDAELETLGYSSHEYVGHNIVEFHADRPVIDDILRRLHAGERLRDCEARMRCKDGAIKTVLIDSSVLWDGGRFVHTQCFTRDITAAKAAAAALLEAKEAAEAANLAKDNFVATLSHELRTPLTPVLATLSAWEEGSAEFPAKLREDVETIRRNIDLEARLIDDLLDLTRIVKGKLALTPEVLDVHRLMDSVVTMYASELNARSLDVITRFDAAAYFVRGDPGRLQQVFWNVLKNAAKFSPDGGRIELTTRNDDAGRIVIAVRDHGVGIAADVLVRLFRPFEQGSDEVVRRYGGLGLGLAISNALMTAHGGTIVAESEGPERGATFTLTLAAAVYGPAPSASVAPARPAPSHAGRKFRLLLVEDHADTGKVLSRLLRGNGHDVELAASVGQAVATFDPGRFDFLVSDLGLPDGTGVDLIRTLRERYGPGLPAVALSGYGMEHDIARCRAAGFDEHITKPVNLQKLEEMIQRVGAAKGGNREKIASAEADPT